MSFLGSKFNLCVLEFNEEWNYNNSQTHDMLYSKRFVDLTPSQEYGDGFAAVNDLLKTEFSLEDIVAADMITGGFRHDKKSVPSPLIKKLYRERLKEEEKDSGKKLSKQEKKDLKERCRSDLILKTLPNPKMATWILDIPNKRFYLDTKNLTIVDSFMKKIEDMFKLNLKIKTYKLGEDSKLTGFLEWVWENIGENTWVDQSLILDADDDTLFKFEGPNIDSYINDILAIKKDKKIKALDIGFVLEGFDYSMKLNNKNMICALVNSHKIKHESVENAVIDNAAKINSVIAKVEKMVNAYERGEQKC